MNKETSYHFQTIGKLWMPMCPAAKEDHITAGKGPFQTDIDPDNELEDLEYYLSTHTGDFSSLTDHRITREVTETESISNGYQERHTFEVLREWKDPDSQNVFDDCMYPEPIEV